MLDVNFRFVYVTRPAPSNLAIRWAIMPTGVDLADIVFEVFKSYSPEGPWDLLGEVQGVYSYLDTEAPGAAITRQPYYKVRAASKTGKGYSDSTAVFLAHDASNIALEMIRKKRVFMRVKSGIAWAVLKRKSYGAKCSRCWNEVRRSAADPDCTECFGTGFVGGFLPAVNVEGIFNPHKAAVIDAGVEYEPFNTYAEFANYPFLDMGDVIVDRRMNTRYEVTNVGYTTCRGFTVSQVCGLNRLDLNSIVYNIPVTDAPNTQTAESYFVQ